ncbi:hypothetical protein BDF20DRAFT_95387 [Mycotypha africana]|uniref:uncharacterized protein n=1 Tax=Mycotypha africana TaxID=64632 RepID=UPI0023009470|nr:uncharacterized protein BDF20DRAFT_95387 [Mycotypha africana]KAI8969945.1 hypothetical protein BDF20DRAFT_95387 [Mycotypha africana]
MLMAIMFFAALTSRFHSILQVLQTRILQPRTVSNAFNVSERQQLHMRDVKYSSIVTARRSPAVSLRFNARHRTPTIPVLRPFR